MSIMEENVFRFQVTMHDVKPIQYLKGLLELSQYYQRLLLSEASLLPESVH